MTKFRKNNVLLRFVQDLFVDGAVTLVSLKPEDTPVIISAIETFHLDFDDAYQYVVAKKHGLVLVSFDKDFDQTDLIRRTPSELIKK